MTTLALLGLLAAGCSSASQDAASQAKPANPQDIVLVQSIRSLSNPYHADWAKGGEMFANSVCLPVQTLANEGDSQQQLNQIKSVLSGGKTVVLNVDPNTSSDTQAIVRAVQDAGGYVVTQWNKPDELTPQQAGNSWVAHISFDGRVSGYQTASYSTSRPPSGTEAKPSKSPRPCWPSTRDRSRGCGQPTTAWRSVRWKPCERPG